MALKSETLFCCASLLLKGSHVETVVSYVIIGFYFLTALVLMVFLFQRGRKGAEIRRAHILNRYAHTKSTNHWPRVTTQIPVYNEYNVVARVMWAVARMKYPKDYLHRTVPFFLDDDRLGLVQARWGHLNWKRSLLTRLQSIGIALSNTRAVLEALMGRESPFVRTPKKGDREFMRYQVRLPWSGLLEILLGIYCSVSLGYYLAVGKYLVGPFLAAYALGFLFVGFLTLAHASGVSK